MKQAIIVGGLVAIAGFSLLVLSAEAAKYAMVKKVAIIEETPEKINVYEVMVSTSTKCYVTQQGKFGSHAISCVK